MASAIVIRRTVKTLNSAVLRTFVTACNRQFSGVATAGEPHEEHDIVSSSSFTFSKDGDKQNSNEKDDSIYVKGPNSIAKSSSSSESVSMPMSFMTGSIVGKRFYKKVSTREADDGNGWTVMLDYRTLKTPSKRPLKCPTRALAAAIAAEWEYQVRSDSDVSHICPEKKKKRFFLIIVCNCGVELVDIHLKALASFLSPLNV